ncbi:glucose-6-phosphate dehydrogenase [Paenibacillus alginolyticus]|uniref:glucose-6-phosphate dehydrogenase n=1 Tax=Paenibacillus alginolyticus TaxID=59839 RepID=UPI000685D076|nr:glucose-6-phosphate dehydrogenase [Paenibacillus alginolyticus]MCY9665703.1 glucose-6-phosphate dehydrogenase [Paenibacillus alginolyticus]
MDAMTFILFGSTGDLAKRKIFPALFNLYLEGKLPRSFSLIGLGRKPYTDAEFKTYVELSLQTFSRSRPNELLMQEFLRFFRYQDIDVTKKEGFRELLNIVLEQEKELDIPENRMFYLSVAPEFFQTIAANIKESGLATAIGWKRLIIEKPFGKDLISARELNDKLVQTFEENEIYRIDHYLGKPMVQNLETLVSDNPILKALWNNRYIANVQITAAETVGVEDRAGYYDKAGAIRDMFQNHMLQLLMMIAIHQMAHSPDIPIGTRKSHILKSLRPLSKENAALDVVRGQYEAGEIGGNAVAGYREEHGVGATSMADTFVAARLWIDDPHWSGVPFYIRTGKRMREKSTRIVVEFKDPQQHASSSRKRTTSPNLLTIQINPDEKITLQLNGKNVLKSGETKPVYMDFSQSSVHMPEAYELLIYDALRGDDTFFARWEETESAWEWVEPLLEAFEENVLPLELYPSGSYGPETSCRLLSEQGFHWWHDEQEEKEQRRLLVI